MDNIFSRRPTYDLPPSTGTDVRSLTDEERCFRILARPPINEMIEIHAKWQKSITDNGMPFNSIRNIGFMIEHGWTWIEFVYARKAYRNR